MPDRPGGRPRYYEGQVLYYAPADRSELEALGLTLDERDGLWFVVATPEARAAMYPPLPDWRDAVTELELPPPPRVPDLAQETAAAQRAARTATTARCEPHPVYTNADPRWFVT